MNNKKKIITLVCTGIVILTLGVFIFLYLKNNNEKTINNTNGSSLTSDDINMEINTDDGDEKIIWSNYEKREITLSNSIKITESGVYNLTGEINDGLITIDTKGDVNLVLNNVSIKNSKGPAIYIKNAENTVITLASGTNNKLTDGPTYTGYDEDVSGVIYSKDDLIFDGTGTLIINSNYQDGIVGKDDLKIISGIYEITSKDDGIRGKDSVYIIDGNFDITSGGDGIKSSNDTDAEKGFILIERGNFNINATLDAIQSETKLQIKDGTFNIATGGGSENVSTSPSWGSWEKNNSKPASSSTDSAKGIKAKDNILIETGTFTFDTSDDAIHSNNYLGIKDGTFNISSGDDGIHADKEIIIDNANINIKKSYEGIESAKITINGGTIKVVAQDDGINIAGGSDSSATNRKGQNNYSSNNNILTINGGNITVSANGDGIDINGSGYIYDGNILVYGPSDNANAALDFDGELIVNGGTILASGSSGMLENISSNSTQYNVTIYFTNNIPSSSTIKIYDSSNNEIASFSGEKNFTSLIVSSSKFKKSGTYTIKINNETYTKFTISSITTIVGSRESIGKGKYGG